jgi:hypothetical protein
VIFRSLEVAAFASLGVFLASVLVLHLDLPKFVAVTTGTYSFVGIYLGYRKFCSEL